jgi:hypothetical protein
MQDAGHPASEQAPKPYRFCHDRRSIAEFCLARAQRMGPLKAGKYRGSVAPARAARGSFGEGRRNLPPSLLERAQENVGRLGA